MKAGSRLQGRPQDAVAHVRPQPMRPLHRTDVQSSKQSARRNKVGWRRKTTRRQISRHRRHGLSLAARRLAPQGAHQGSHRAAHDHSDRSTHHGAHGSARCQAGHRTAAHESRLGFALGFFGQQADLRCAGRILRGDAVAWNGLFCEIRIDRLNGVNAWQIMVGRAHGLSFTGVRWAICLVSSLCNRHATACSRSLRPCTCRTTASQKALITGTTRVKVGAQGGRARHPGALHHQRIGVF